MQEMGAEPPDHRTGSALSVLRLFSMARGHGTHRSSVGGGGGGLSHAVTAADGKGTATGNGCGSGAAPFFTLSCTVHICRWALVPYFLVQPEAASAEAAFL